MPAIVLHGTKSSYVFSVVDKAYQMPDNGGVYVLIQSPDGKLSFAPEYIVHIGICHDFRQAFSPQGEAPRFTYSHAYLMPEFRPQRRTQVLEDLVSCARKAG